MKKYLIYYLLLISISEIYPRDNFADWSAFYRNNSDETQLSTSGNFQAKYVFLSLILPGTGEWLLGYKKNAKFFIGTEVVFWASYLGTQAYIGALENDYVTFAALHAGVNTKKKSEQFWIDIGNAEDVYSFNEKKRVERNIDSVYPELSENYWEWDSRDNRITYNEKRFKQHDWKRNLNLIIGGFIFNRIVSAVDVIRLIRKDKKSEQKQYSRLFFDYHTNRKRGESFRLNLMLNW